MPATQCLEYISDNTLFTHIKKIKVSLGAPIQL